MTFIYEFKWIERWMMLQKVDGAIVGNRSTWRYHQTSDHPVERPIKSWNEFFEIVSSKFNVSIRSNSNSFDAAWYPVGLIWGILMNSSQRSTGFSFEDTEQQVSNAFSEERDCFSKNEKYFTTKEPDDKANEFIFQTLIPLSLRHLLRHPLI